MLYYLRIRNLALIEDIKLELVPGFNVLTGETGAGKSFILKAIDFLTGERLGADLVRPNEEKVIVEALFILSDGDCLIRRELTAATGRSRFWINDELRSQDAVRQLTPSLLVHVGQHGRERLLEPSYQTTILDHFLVEANLPAEKDRLLKAIKTVAGQLDALGIRVHELEEKRELLELQHREIERVAPWSGEEAKLEEIRKKLLESAQAEAAAGEALRILRTTAESGLIDGLYRLAQVLESMLRLKPDLTDVHETVIETKERLTELEISLRRQRFEATCSGSLESIEKRLYELSQLKRWLKRSLDEIIDLKQELENNLSFLDAYGLDRKQLQQKEIELAEELFKVLVRLNTGRREAANRLCHELEVELAGLGFSEQIQVLCEFSPQHIYRDISGMPDLTEDRARFLWQPNPGQPAQPLERIASGGELSRFLLALTGLSARDEDTTLIFDEVDTGVGGLTLNRVAERLAALARKQQCICITHWPQLAALAERHFHVHKDVVDGQTFTHVTLLAQAELETELARMAGGGEQGIALARQLLAYSSCG
ncbi:DNA repair protein RecN [Desulfovibrionales bacterium]